MLLVTVQRVTPRHGNPGRSRRTDRFLRLLFALSRVVFLPAFFVVLAYPRYAESVKRRVLVHRHARGFRACNVAVNDGCFSALQAELAFAVVAGAPDRDSRLQVNAFLVGSRVNDNHIAGAGGVDSGLNRIVVLRNSNRGGCRMRCGSNEDGQHSQCNSRVQPVDTPMA